MARSATQRLPGEDPDRTPGEAAPRWFADGPGWLATLGAALFRYRVFLKYCCVGAAVTGVDFLVFWFAFYELGLRAVPSKLLAFSSAVVVSYTLNRLWTFRATQARVSPQFARFAAVSMIGAGFSAGIIFLLVDLITVHPLAANAVTSCAVLSWNFLANKYWTFRVSCAPRPIRMTPRCHVSLVIPAFNEEHRVSRTLAEDIDYLRRQRYSWEIVVVDDGSRDRTVALVGEYSRRFQNQVRLVRLPRNQGKGAAVQLGVVNATGRFIFIADADNATPIEEMGAFLQDATEREILIGSRYVESSTITQHQSRARILLGRAGNLLIRTFLIDGIADTQCGFKLFPAAIAHDLFARQRVRGWGFDMEILSMAQSMGIPIRERGVLWRDVAGSRLRPIRAALRTFLELVAIKINLWSGVYD